MNKYKCYGIRKSCPFNGFFHFFLFQPMILYYISYLKYYINIVYFSYKQVR